MCLEKPDRRRNEADFQGILPSDDGSDDVDVENWGVFRDYWVFYSIFASNWTLQTKIHFSDQFGHLCRGIELL